MVKRKWTEIGLFAVKCLTVAYILTGLLLLLVAMLLYKIQLSEKVVNILVVVIYVLAGFFCGFITGKKMMYRRFVWGGLMGIIYFVVLFVISWIANQGFPELSMKFGSTCMLCVASGMLGGMISGN